MKYKLSEFAPAGPANVYRSPGVGDISYTDGDEIENRIREILRRVYDKSTSSEELANAIVDWPTEYHFSRERGNLLRHIDFNSDDSILELGAGCGSITRQFGESGARVTAIEGSLVRAECASIRCQDLPNVKVFCENFENIIFEEQYDYITLIGVLEYAPLFFNSTDPIQSCLQIVKKHLKPNGKLLLAIENKLGLKYFMGCSEDHTGMKYFGIEDRYTSQTAITFGRHELSKVLRAAGLNGVDFMYPFPDYKVPNQIYFENAFNDEVFKPEIILAKCRSRDYMYPNHVNNFNESRTWATLKKNNLVQDFANSFLVVASHEEMAADKEFLAITYQSTRKPQYCVQTYFKRSNAKEIEVSKELIFPDKVNLTSFLELNLEFQKYENGVLLSSRLREAVTLKNYQLFAQCCNCWLEYIRLNCAPGSDLSQSIEPEFIDCIPQNLILGSDNALYFIDREWVTKEGYPFNFLILRGLYQLQTESGYSEFLLESSSIFSEYARRWLRSIGLELNSALALNFLKLESRLVDEVYGVNSPAPVRDTQIRLRQNSFSGNLYKKYVGLLKKIYRRLKNE